MDSDVFSIKTDRTDLIIGQSKAKNCEETAGDVRIGIAPPKSSKNMEKREKFCDEKNFRRRKTKCWESPETDFRKVSWRSALISRGKRSFEIFGFVFPFFFTTDGSFVLVRFFSQFWDSCVDVTKKAAGLNFSSNLADVITPAH